MAPLGNEVAGAGRPRVYHEDSACFHPASLVKAPEHLLVDAVGQRIDRPDLDLAEAGECHLLLVLS
jgi:hypothetical protein